MFSHTYDTCTLVVCDHEYCYFLPRFGLLHNTTHWGKIEGTRSLVLCLFSYSKHANGRIFFQVLLPFSPVRGELPSLVGGIVFIITIIVIIIADAFHITHDAALLPLGAIISGITELMAGLNFLYDKASKQFGRFHLFIDRIIRYSIAHAMTEEIKDPGQKQLNIEKIITELLENDSRIKD